MHLKFYSFGFLLLVGFQFSAVIVSAENETDAEVGAKPSPDEKPTRLDFETVYLQRGGGVKGFLEKSSQGLSFYSFLGIPYAKPPTGNLRFKDPVASEPFEGVRDGTVSPPFCSQIDINSLIMGPNVPYLGEEDCLYLNIYTPEPNFEYANMPVLVYIHGGHFASGGASDYEPYDFMNAPVVLVVIQYRLGVLGFMSTEDSVMPGNLGLKDQTLALKWVNQNIEIFGGSPVKITLFGSGSGAASVHYQTLSHHTIGLFRGAILQSGTALCPWAKGGVYKEAAYYIGKHLKCLPEDEEEEEEGKEEKEKTKTEDGSEVSEDGKEKESDEQKKDTKTETDENISEENVRKESKEGEKTDKESESSDTKDENSDSKDDPEIDTKKLEETMKNEELLKCLQEADVKDLAESAKLLYLWSNMPTIFGPRIDHQYLPESTEFLLQNGRHKRLDLIIGINKDDGSSVTNSLFISEGRRMALKHHFPLIGPISLEFGDDDLAPLNMSIKAYDKYSGGIKADAEEAYNMTKLYTDRHFGICSDLTADYHSTNNQKRKKNVFVYEFSHRGQRSTGDAFNLNFGKEWVSHGDELYTLFPFTKQQGNAADQEDEKMKELMIQMWYLFAETGNPTPNGTFSFTWEPYTKDTRRHLKITTEPHMEEDNRGEAREFWSTLPTGQNLFLNKEYFKNILIEIENEKEKKRRRRKWENGGDQER